MLFLPVDINGKKVYAGFWKRFGAALVDMLVYSPFVVIFHYIQGLSLVAAMISVVISSLFFTAYTIYFHYKFGATLGKMATGIKLTLPNGHKIGIKQALLRSSVDLGFAVFMIVAQVMVLSNADPEVYLNAGWVERGAYITPLLPVWYSSVNIAIQLWFCSELIVLLFNKRKRAIHDFIAGTVVISREYAEQVTALDSVENAPAPTGIVPFG